MELLLYYLSLLKVLINIVFFIHNKLISTIKYFKLNKKKLVYKNLLINLINIG